MSFFIVTMTILQAWILLLCICVEVYWIYCVFDSIIVSVQSSSRLDELLRCSCLGAKSCPLKLKIPP